MWIKSVLLGLFVSAAFGAEEKLNLATPSGYFSGDVIPEFERRFHCKVVTDLFEEPEAALAKVQSGGASLYDVLITADYTITPLIRQKLLAPIPHERIANLQNLEPGFRKTQYDPELKYSIPFQWGTIGIYARKIPGQDLDPSWSLFFDPKKQPGPIVLLDSMRDTIGAALKSRGYSFNTTDRKQLLEARDLLLDAKKRALEFANSPGGRAKVLDKSARAAIVFSAEGGRGMSEDPETIYFIPREGSEIWVDNLTILAQAPHRDLAEKFINYLFEPETSAQISNYSHCASPNLAARRFIKPEILNNPALYPSEEARKKLELLKDLGRDTRLYDQLWTTIKSR
ncbi:MAG TPA: spermidine/putrescine ABC transporter substrate-binding protein [Verrucomicrobiae bacterium]|jgi:spermidine/putrescine transport system substrate-binding protein|nr:spermidine/putrescine ABC transporter substrate-binding protein [Verrucomicrobiae bacterium]